MSSPRHAPALVAEGEERAGGRRAADGGVVLVRVNDAADDADLGWQGGGEEGVRAGGKGKGGSRDSFFYKKRPRADTHVTIYCPQTRSWGGGGGIGPVAEEETK